MKKILVIEDHSDMHELLIWQVELMGFTALSAKNAADGVNLALAEKPDLILMDIMLPGLDGFAATRMLRANAQTSGTQILAVTALFRSSDLQACIDAGCADYILKPFTFAELEKKIHALISMNQ